MMLSRIHSSVFLLIASSFSFCVFLTAKVTICMNVEIHQHYGFRLNHGALE